MNSASDPELLRGFQEQPQAARYFMALFCRYCHQVNETLQKQEIPSQRVPPIHSWIWLQLHSLLQTPDPDSLPNLEPWLIAQVQTLLPQIPETDPYPSASLPPPLFCYLTLGLATLPGDLRFMVVLAACFGWSIGQIRTQLAAEGYLLSNSEIENAILQGRTRLFQAIPADIRVLYLTSRP